VLQTLSSTPQTSSSLRALSCPRAWPVLLVETYGCNLLQARLRCKPTGPDTWLKQATVQSKGTRHVSYWRSAGHASSVCEHVYVYSLSPYLHASPKYWVWWWDSLTWWRWKSAWCLQLWTFHVHVTRGLPLLEQSLLLFFLAGLSLLHTAIYLVCNGSELGVMLWLMPYRASGFIFYWLNLCWLMAS